MMNNIVDDIKNNSKLTKYCQFSCLDGYLDYIYSELYHVVNFELLFIDRYLGMRRTDEVLESNSNLLKLFLYKNGLIEFCRVKPESLREIFNETAAAGHKMLVDTQFIYPDEKERFSYYSYILIDEMKEDFIVVTKLANIDPKLQSKESLDYLSQVLDIQDGTVGVYKVKNSELISSIGQNNPNKIITEIVKLLEVNKDYFNKLFEQQNQIDMVIKDTITHHRHKVDEYIANGIPRNIYPQFIRQIQEQVNPILECIQAMHRCNIHLDSETEEIKSFMVNEINKASNSILIFCLKNNSKKYFEEYLKHMELLDIYYNKFKMGFHNFVMENIKA